MASEKRGNVDRAREYLRVTREYEAERDRCQWLLDEMDAGKHFEGVEYEATAARRDEFAQLAKEMRERYDAEAKKLPAIQRPA